MESNTVILTPTQCRMARAGLELGVRELAALAKVSPNTVSRLERREVLRDATLLTIRKVLEGEGAIFMSMYADDVLGVGVMCADVVP
jgi:transcriptional regulator with XRE-family HTH domain